MAGQEKPLSARDSGPGTMGWMQGFPPAPAMVLIQAAFSLHRIRWPPTRRTSRPCFRPVAPLPTI